MHKAMAYTESQSIIPLAPAQSCCGWHFPPWLAGGCGRIPVPSFAVPSVYVKAGHVHFYFSSITQWILMRPGQWRGECFNQHRRSRKGMELNWWPLPKKLSYTFFFSQEIKHSLRKQYVLFYKHWVYVKGKTLIDGTTVQKQNPVFDIWPFDLWH